MASLTYGARPPWVGIGAAVWMQIAAGNAYNFPLYSHSLKSVLGLNQYQLAMLGVANDIGENVGLLPGLVCDRFPPWIVLLIGAFACFFGYGVLWLALTGTVTSLPYWALWFALCIATNSNAWFTTGILVTNLRNFPQSRGTVAGILKGYGGISAAVYTEVYSVLLDNSSSKLLMFLALGVPTLCFMLMSFVRPCNPASGEDPSDINRFRFIQVSSAVLGVYVLTTTIVDDKLSLSAPVAYSCLLVMVLLLMAPFAIPLKMTIYPSSGTALTSQDNSNTAEPLLEPTPAEPLLEPTPAESLLEPTLAEPLLEPTPTQPPLELEPIPAEPPLELEPTPAEPLLEPTPAEPPLELEPTPAEPLKQPTPSLASIGSSYEGDEVNMLLAVSEGATRRRRPRRGENFTFCEVLIKADFWLLFAVYFVGVGSGVTVLNNLAQIGKAQYMKDTKVLLSLFSFCNFVGRLGGGIISEKLLRSKAYPRTIWMAISQIVMVITYLLFASGLHGTLLVATSLLGICYGCHFSIMVPTASELFGLTSFGVIFNFISLGNPLGAFLFSSLLAGYLYDVEAGKQESKTCLGPDCFRLTFYVLAGVCAVGTILSIYLTKRIMIVYQRLYAGGSHRLPERSEDGQEPMGT